MSWIKGKRKYGRSIVAALIFLGIALFAGVTVQAGLGAHKNVTVTADGFVLNKSKTAVMSYEGDGGDIIIPDGVTTIAAGAFLENEDVTGVDLNDVRTIGNNAFAKSGLESVEGGELVRAIGGNAFAETKLTEFEVPDGLLRLAQDAFSGVKTLQDFSGGSDNYPVVGNCIYADEGDTLYILPGGRTHVESSAKKVKKSAGSAKTEKAANGDSDVAKSSASAKVSSKNSDSDVAKSSRDSGSVAEISKADASTNTESSSAESEVARVKKATNGASDTSKVAVTDVEEIAGGGLEGPDPLAEYEANSKLAAELDEEDLADDEEDYDDFDDEEDDEGIDWVDAEVLAAASAGRYAVVEHSLDTYDVNGGTSSSTSNEASTDAANSAGNSSSSSSTSNASGSTNTTANAGTSSGTISNETVARARDATPKTADGDIDPKFVFCVALFLAGLAGLIFVRQRSLVGAAVRHSVADSGELD